MDVLPTFVTDPLFPPARMTAHIFLLGFLSGVFWSVGSIGQIIGTSLLGVVLGDWATGTAEMYGFIALALIIAGIFFTSYKQQDGKGIKPKRKQGIQINLIATLGFTAYVGILKYYKLDGWSSIFPQSVGQIVAIALASLLMFRMQPFSRLSFKNSVIGIIWGVGNIALLLSQARLGLSIAYPVSQAAVIVSVFGGVFINREHKTRKEWIATGIGILVICAGLFMIYLSSRH